MSEKKVARINFSVRCINYRQTKFDDDKKAFLWLSRRQADHNFRLRLKNIIHFHPSTLSAFDAKDCKLNLN